MTRITFCPQIWKCLGSAKDLRRVPIHALHLWKQDSPPVWTQEAYCPPRSKYSLCCSISRRVGYLPWTGVPKLDWGVPTLDRGVSTLNGGYLPWTGGIYSEIGVPPVRLDGGIPSLSGCIGYHLPPGEGWMGYLPRFRLDGVPPPGEGHIGVSPLCGQTDGQTHIKTLPSLVPRNKGNF